jgi:two-component system, sensor histidine kinase RegB
VSGETEPGGQKQAELGLGLTWLLRVRWGAICGQVALLCFMAWALEAELPYLELSAVLGVAIGTNAWLSWWRGEGGGRWLLSFVLLLDVALLTVMLGLSGGASNPFAVFFLVHVALATVCLERGQAWATVAVTGLAYGALFLLPDGGHMGHAGHAHQGHGASGLRSHLVGMWFAYVLAAGFVAYFVGRAAEALRAADRERIRLGRLAAQNERLATLSSFAANAAHELGSPLGTIAIASGELALELERQMPRSVAASDARLIGDEVARCRRILSNLAARSGESMGEMPVWATAEDVLSRVMDGFSEAQRGRLNIEMQGDASRRFCVPLKTLAQMLQNLVRNAWEAEQPRPAQVPVELRVRVGPLLTFEICDRGVGFPEHLLGRIGEPFLTTKAEHGGLGLGLYLASVFAARLGGQFLVQNRAGGGTAVLLEVAGTGSGSTL